MCPAVYLTFGIIKSTFYEAAANRFINDQLSFENTQVLDKKISYDHKEVRVVLIGPEVPDASISIARSKLKEYKLEDTKLIVLQGMNNEAVDVSSIRAMVMEDFYKNSEQRLQQQAVKISQLETTLEQYRTYDAMSRTLVPELKVLYPSITTLSIAHSLEVRVDSMKTDTVTLAVLKFARHPSVAEKEKISEWLKARFDEENNLATAEMMKAAGINIIFSIPGLKVHAKVALVLRRDKEGRKLTSYAYISTGNFNEKTATLYADSGLFTCNPVIVNDLHNLFRTLQGKENPVFHRLLVARFNLIPELNRLINHEIELTRQGKQGRIILKMNALQDPAMIDRLYEASQAGVEIDLIVRGICCLIPGQEYSHNIRVTRIVDTFLEHARVWYFGNGGAPKLFLGSPDWMRRNLYRRIEAVTPILDPDLKQELIDMLSIQLSDKRKACFVDDRLRNRWKSSRPQKEKVRSQYSFYEYLREKI